MLFELLSLTRSISGPCLLKIISLHKEGEQEMVAWELKKTACCYKQREVQKMSCQVYFSLKQNSLTTASFSDLGGTGSKCTWSFHLLGMNLGFCWKQKLLLVVSSEQTFVCITKPFSLAPGPGVAQVGPSAGEPGCCRSGLQAVLSVESLPSQPTLSDFSQCYLLHFQEHLFLSVTFCVSLPHTHLKNKNIFYRAKHFK